VRAILLITLALAMILGGCSRHSISDKPPVHLVTNMDDQPKVKPQSESRFYADGLAMRAPVEGTVARGWLHADSSFFYRGIDDDGKYISVNPLTSQSRLEARGAERFGIYCVPCHATLGTGKSIMVEKKMPPPPSFHEERLRDSTDGYIFHVITDGLGNMPPYKYQIPPADRWAIIAHVRALQATQPVEANTTLESRQAAREKK